MRPQSSAVILLHLRRLDQFLKRQGLLSTAHALERESLAYLDAAHLQKLVEDGQWDAAWGYLRSFSPLWEAGEGTNQQYTDFLHMLEHHAMLDYLACRGDQGGRVASSLFWCSSNDGFRSNFPETAQRHDLYRSMASKQARALIDWEAIKLTTLEKLQELLHLHPDIECSLRMREPRHTSMPSEIIPLGLRGCFRRHTRRKRVDRKPARELALFITHKRLPTSRQDPRHSGASGVSSGTILHQKDAKRVLDISSSAANTGTKRPRSVQHDYNSGNAQQPLECFKRPRTTGDVGEPGEISARVLEGWVSASAPLLSSLSPEESCATCCIQEQCLIMQQ